MRGWQRAGVAAAIVLIAVWGLEVAGRRAAGLVPLTPREQVVKSALRSLWQRVDDAAAAGDPEALRPLFDLSTAEGRAALRHAEARLAFVQAWAKARGVRWLAPRVSVRTPAIRFSGPSGSAVHVTAIVSESWGYAYPDGGEQRFGLGRVQFLTLTRSDDGTWRIMRDRFIDPLDQDTRIPGPAAPETSSSVPPAATAAPTPAAGAASQGYDRAGAVAYADRYCGAAPGCGNDGRYNPRFHDYNLTGGDCTNFISQALSLGGELPQTPTWGFDPRTGEGTAAWVKAPNLIDQLTASGWARVVARGPYATAVDGLQRLSPGDVIAYAERGRIVHLALVVGRDVRGYVLVDSHTADRYHVPWDIGWDRKTIFTLLHIARGEPHQSGPPPFPPAPAAAPGCDLAGPAAPTSARR